MINKNIVFRPHNPNDAIEYKNTDTFQQYKYENTENTENKIYFNITTSYQNDNYKG
tara:strand:+ start:4199 stop:4366 length:168 start_codon:yes stop_codon:yes gene_type:complete